MSDSFLQASSSLCHLTSVFFITDLFLTPSRPIASPSSRIAASPHRLQIGTPQLSYGSDDVSVLYNTCQIPIQLNLNDDTLYLTMFLTFQDDFQTSRMSFRVPKAPPPKQKNRKRRSMSLAKNGGKQQRVAVEVNIH